MAFELPSEINSRQDIQALALEVRNYAGWLAHNDIKKRLKVRKPSPTPELSSGASETLHDWLMRNPLSSSSLDKLADALENLKDSAPSATITLVAPAGSKLKQDLTNWCRKNIDDNILVDFEFNSALLGGMVLRCGSHVFDWSFRRQLLDNQGKFAEVLANVR